MKTAGATELVLARALPRSVLALGGELKNTVCWAQGTTARLRGKMGSGVHN